jgi:transposase
LVTAAKRRRLRDAYRFAGFRPIEQVRGVFGDPHARIITLIRRSKNQLRHMRAEAFRMVRSQASPRSGSSDRRLAHISGVRGAARQVPHCGKVKRERLEFLADNPLYTKRFAFYVGRRCRSSPIQDVAKELKLDWHTVKELDKQYMRAQLAKAGTPAPMVIGIDEISVRKGHSYRIVVSDLIRERPIWFGGNDRSEASMTQFYQWLGTRAVASGSP